MSATIRSRSASLGLALSALLLVALLPSCGGGSSAPPPPLPTFSGFVYAGHSSGLITAFRINSGGTLSAVNGAVPAHNTPIVDMVAAPNGSSVFVASDASANILQAFAANTSTGTLSAPTQVAFTQPADLAVSSGGILAALSEQNISVAAYRVNGGALAAFGLPATTSVSAKAVSFSSGSAFVYVISAFDSTVTAYSFDSGTGNITFLGAEAVPAPQDFDTAALNHVAVDPLGRFLFASTDTGRVYVFTLSASTGLASFIRQISVTPGNRISSILISPDGQFLYVTDFTSNRVLGFAIVADGTLAPVSIAPPSTDVGPVAMTFDSTSRLLCTVNQTNASITVFTRNSTTGVLTTLTPAVPTGGPSPTAIASIP